MIQTTIKSLEYEDLIQDQEYKVKAFISSAPEELELTNIDIKENKGFIFKISVSTEPKLPVHVEDIDRDLIYIIGNGGDNRLGYLNNDTFVELEENRFLQGLEANVLSILLIAGDTGNFKI